MCWENMSINEISAMVPLQSLLDHTAKRILETKPPRELEKLNNHELLLTTKWVLDGSSGQSEFAQKYSINNNEISDSNLFMTSIVRLMLTIPIDVDQSVDRFGKMADLPQQEIEVEKSKPTEVVIGINVIRIRHILVMTILDGKVAQAITNTKCASACYICSSLPSEMNDLAKIQQKPHNVNALEVCISTLHARIKWMEYILHNNNFEKWTTTKDTHENEKKRIQQEFLEKVGIKVDCVKQGYGSSNNGNTARRFFNDYKVTSAITGVDETILHRIATILEVINSNAMIDPEKFWLFSKETAEMDIEKYSWYFMPSTVHKILLHGAEIVQKSILPVGILSEEAQESRNKDYKTFRIRNSRKMSRISTNEDVFHHWRLRILFESMDMRPEPKKNHLEISDAAKELLIKLLEFEIGGRCWPSLGTLLAALSLVFSLGNLLRLPRLVLIHGGGTFLAIYGGITILFGIPLAFLEIVLGQFCQEGTTKLWRAVPLLKGVGYVKVLCSLLLAVYYPVVMAISLFYGLWTVKGPLPFSECLQPTIGEEQTQASLLGETCLEKTFLKPPESDIMWFGVNVTLLFLLWAFVMLCLCQGSKSYRTAAMLLTLPLIGLMAALLTLKLTESSDGLIRLFTFTWDPVFRFDTWYYAMVQFFFSTHIGFGNLTTCAGNIYSKSSAFWVAFCYILLNLAVGTGMVILVYLWIGNGIVSWHQVPILFVLTQIYDTAIFAKNGQLIASLAYLMIVLAGFTSMIALVYTIVVSIVVETKNKWRSWLITATICGIGLIIGIAIMLPEKLKFLHMLDHYVIGHMVAMSTALELVGFLWVYGVDTLCNDFEFVLGYKLSKVWNVVWFTTPIFLVAVEVSSLFLLPLNGEDVEDDRWVYLTGWFMYLFLWFIIIFIGLWQLCAQVDYNLAQKLHSSLKPTRNWGPVDPLYRHGWVQWRDSYQNTGERDFTLKRRGTRDYTHSIKSEQRYSTMSLPRPNSAYVVQLPETYWSRSPHQQKSPVAS